VQSWYTDGSKSPNTGWSGTGVYRQDTNKGAYFSLGERTTIFQAGLFAVTEGEGVIEIYPDSQAVLKALCSARMGNRLIQECWDALTKVAEQKQVNLVWIPAHMGFAGNERADALARIGSSETPITAEPHIGLSHRQVASALSDWALEGITEMWRKAEECRQAKELIEIPSDAKAKSKWLMSRSLKNSG